MSEQYTFTSFLQILLSFLIHISFLKKLSQKPISHRSQFQLRKRNSLENRISSSLRQNGSKCNTFHECSNIIGRVLNLMQYLFLNAKNHTKLIPKHRALKQRFNFLFKVEFIFYQICVTTPHSLWAWVCVFYNSAYSWFCFLLYLLAMILDGRNELFQTCFSFFNCLVFRLHNNQLALTNSCPLLKNSLSYASAPFPHRKYLTIFRVLEVQARVHIYGKHPFQLLLSNNSFERKTQYRRPQN